MSTPVDGIGTPLNVRSALNEGTGTPMDVTSTPVNGIGTPVCEPSGVRACLRTPKWRCRASRAPKNAAIGPESLSQGGRP